MNEYLKYKLIIKACYALIFSPTVKRSTILLLIFNFLIHYFFINIKACFNIFNIFFFLIDIIHYVYNNNLYFYYIYIYMHFFFLRLSNYFLLPLIEVPLKFDIRGLWKNNEQWKTFKCLGWKIKWLYTQLLFKVFSSCHRPRIENLN